MQKEYGLFGKIVSWVFAVLFLLAGYGMVTDKSRSPVEGLLVLLAGIILIPQVNDKIFELISKYLKAEYRGNKFFRVSCTIGAVFLLFMCGSAIGLNNAKANVSANNNVANPVSVNKTSENLATKEYKEINEQQLIAMPAEYLHKKIAIKCNFGVWNASTLDDGENDKYGNALFRASEKFVSFCDSYSKLYFFAPKNMGDVLFSLNCGDEITVYGRAFGLNPISIPYIDIYMIEKGW